MSAGKSLQIPLGEGKSIKMFETMRFGKATWVLNPVGTDEVPKGITQQRLDKAVLSANMTWTKGLIPGTNVRHRPQPNATDRGKARAT